MLLRLLILALIVMTTSIFAQTPPIETGVSHTLAKWRAANYSDVRYKLNITLEKGAALMKGDIEIRVNLTEIGAKNDLILDWRTTQFANDKDKPFADVIAVNNTSTVNSRETIIFLREEHLIISSGLLKKGENVIKINFASPIKTSGAAITRYVDKEDGAEYVYSLFVPSDASTAFPVFDQPDLKARFQLSIRPPQNWKVVSNTVVSSRPRFDPMDTGVYVFAETKPISTYVFAFAAGDFAEFEDKDFTAEAQSSRGETQRNSQRNSAPLRLGGKNSLQSKIYVRKSQAEKFKQHVAEVFRLNREGVKFLENWFDYKFPFPKYDLVLIPEFPFGGMEHAGATFLREDRVIFPTEPTKNDYITRANVIFHEAAHQWFGDTVTMRWFDDLWLKEGFAEFMAYKTLEKVMPEYNAWKIFYERNKQAAYLTDSTRGTTPIYQEIPNLSAAKSAYGNIVYRKAPSFLRQAEFYLGEDKFQTAVRAFLKKHEFANASWQDLVEEIAEVKIAETKKSDFYQTLSTRDKGELESFTRWSIRKEWAEFWVEKRGTQIYRISPRILDEGWKWALNAAAMGGHTIFYDSFSREGTLKDENYNWLQDVKVLKVYEDGEREVETAYIGYRKYAHLNDQESKPREEYKFEPQTEESRKQYEEEQKKQAARKPLYIFPNYQDYGYGIFLLDERSRAYVLANIQTAKDDFLRTMMWGALWDSVRETELAPADYVELVIKNINVESDESTIQTILGRVSTAMNYYLSDAQAKELAPKLEAVLIDKMQNTPTLGQRITFYRAFLSVASSDKARAILKDILNGKLQIKDLQLKSKDKYDILTRLVILNDAEGKQLLFKKFADDNKLSDEERRYAYAAAAGSADKEIKQKYFNDFLNNKEISESYIESAFVPFNAPRQSDLTLPYLEKALAELPNLKKNRKIFFINGWLGAFIGGQKSEEALAIVNKFLADNPNLDKDLRLKILENADGLERAVKIRAKYGK